MVNVLFQSADWIVLDKPPGWLTVPGRTAPGGEPLPVLSEWAAERFGTAMTVHRLDRDTSGVVLFARSESAHKTANDWFQNRKMKKI
jgi:23S rRNA-/tRNA-specific pseudouridylate synthase